MDFKLVVFDIAGTTLVDNENSVANAFKWAIHDFGVIVDSASIKRVMGYKKSEAIAILLKDARVTHTEDDIIEIHQNFLKTLNKQYSDQKISEIEGASEVFSLLKKNGVKVSLNTGFGRSTADIIISKLGWKKNELIDSSITSDEVQNGRPAPDMIQNLANRFDIKDPGHIVKIGDTPSDLLEGKGANCGLVIGVTYGTHTKEELLEFPHDYLIDDIRDFPELLLSHSVIR